MILLQVSVKFLLLAIVSCVVVPMSLFVGLWLA
jgi:hypothetical protein